MIVAAPPQNRNRYVFLIPFSSSEKEGFSVCIFGFSAYKVMERKISVSVPGLSTSGVCLIRIAFAGISAPVGEGAAGPGSSRPWQLDQPGQPSGQGRQIFLGAV